MELWNYLFTYFFHKFLFPTDMFFPFRSRSSNSNKKDTITHIFKRNGCEFLFHCMWPFVGHILTVCVLGGPQQLLLQWNWKKKQLRKKNPKQSPKATRFCIFIYFTILKEATPHIAINILYVVSSCHLQLV